MLKWIYPAALAAAALCAPSVSRAQDAGESSSPSVSSPSASSPSASSPLPAAPSAVIARQQADRPATSPLRFQGAAATPGPGGLPVESPVGGELKLSLADAIDLGLERNIRLRYVKANDRVVKGLKLQVENGLFFPNLQLKASSSAQEINLAAMGFKPSLLSGITIPGVGSLSNIPTIVKVNTTSAQVSLTQTVFDFSSYELFRALPREFQSVALNTTDSREQLVQAVATAYLRVLADDVNLNNDEAQEAAAKVLFDQATAKQQAGVGVHLDTLRAQVEWQQRQQSTVQQAAALNKDVIQLNRIMGLPAGQRLDLTDEIPFAALDDMDLDSARGLAYSSRADYLSLGAQIDVAVRELKAVKYQRLPTVAINGFYGVLGETTGLYHGDFVATGSVKFPIFREAAQRGEEQQVSAQLMQLRQRQGDMRGMIDQQLRASMLDMQSDAELVKVADSNVKLAEQELADARDRFTSGVDDNLPVVNAQATVTGAQAQLVQAQFQYNVAKLGFAKNLGLLQSRYRQELGM